MRLRKLTLRHFRNVSFAALDFAGRQTFLVGANGHGKTSLLEAAGFITALRSFRTSEPKQLVTHTLHTAAISCTVDHEQQGETKLTIKLHHGDKELWSDQTRVTRLADHLGKFPMVVFSSQDLQLVRGSPAGRRRWLDLTLSAMDVRYFRALQTFSRALAERNALLKSGRPVEKELEAFEQTLAPAAAELIALREAGLKALGQSLASAYGKLCDHGEPASLGYDPDFAEASAESLLARLEAGRARDTQFRTTLVGPHRDDFHFMVKHTPAREFGSEGQQRSLVLALRLAQAEWFHQKSGVRPVLLCDDVLGELDPARRRRFWSAIDHESQVIATGTTLPDAELGAWQVFEVMDGDFAEKAPSAEAQA
jgi:DNA replication and repair protein RecF